MGLFTQRRRDDNDRRPRMPAWYPPSVLPHMSEAEQDAYDAAMARYCESIMPRLPMIAFQGMHVQVVLGFLGGADDGLPRAPKDVRQQEGGNGDV